MNFDYSRIAPTRQEIDEYSKKNLAILADKTWYSSPSLYQKANMNLYITNELQTSETSWSKLKPRTVRDCIPKSKLAQYGDYQYDESRELSYTPIIFSIDLLNEQLENERRDEPWMLEEIDYLFVALMERKPPKNPYGMECEFESPFFEAKTFEEMALKAGLTKKSVKRIWEENPLTDEVEEEELETQPEAPEAKPTEDIAEQQETHHEKIENPSKLTQTYIPSPPQTISTQEPDLEPQKRLYSAVLRGSPTPATDPKPIPQIRFPKKRPLKRLTRPFAYQLTFPYLQPRFFSTYIPLIFPPQNFFLQPQINFTLFNQRSAMWKRRDLMEDFIEELIKSMLKYVLDEEEDYIPVTQVSSEELERMALEQYESQTNLLDQLERQAKEQYEEEEGEGDCIRG